MCGCEHHGDFAAPCTCECPEHEAARNLTAARATTTAREWQPGDVALRTGRDGTTAVSLVVQADRYRIHCWGNHGDAPHWHHSNGGWNTLADEPKYGSYRPLVVIDPEDIEAVERLARESHDRIHKPGSFDDLSPMSQEALGELMQAALREFANPTPPKPDEPQGLGAVVRDADGDLWVRRSDVHFICPKNPNEALTWAEVEAVEVLSEGWSE